MPWDSKGWHEFEGGSGMGELNFCVHCRFHKSAHLSKVDYVSMRLEGKRTPDPFTFPPIPEDVKRELVLQQRKLNQVIQAQLDILSKTVSPAGVLQKTES